MIKIEEICTYIQVCSNTDILRDDVYWRVCVSWDHQILRTQIRTFEPKLLYKNKQIQSEWRFRCSYKKKGKPFEEWMAATTFVKKRNALL